MAQCRFAIGVTAFTFSIYRIPVGSGPGPEARRKETGLPIVATSSGRLFLNGLLAGIARFSGTRNLTCNSTSPGKRGHFYFALTRAKSSLTSHLDSYRITPATHFGDIYQNFRGIYEAAKLVLSCN